MKINIGKVPIRISLDAPKVGEVYRAKGGRGTTAFWLVAAVHENSSHLLGLDREGNIVSTSSYGNHAIVNREVVGFVEGLDALTLDMKWEAV